MHHPALLHFDVGEHLTPEDRQASGEGEEWHVDSGRRQRCSGDGDPAERPAWQGSLRP